MKKIKAIIWDLDNTLYRFNEAFVETCNRAAAQTVVDLGYTSDFGEAFQIAEESYKKHGYSASGFVKHYGVPYADYHFPFHEAIDETVIEPIDALDESIAALDLPHVIVTHASRGWTERILDHLQISHFFKSDDIIALEDADFEVKAYSERPFQLAKEKLDHDHENILMVEDNVRNLEVPKRMGIQTAMVHRISDQESLPDFVDYEFSDTVTMINTLLDRQSG